MVTQAIAEARLKIMLEALRDYIKVNKLKDLTTLELVGMTGTNRNYVLKLMTTLAFRYPSEFQFCVGEFNFSSKLINLSPDAVNQRNDVIIVGGNVDRILRSD